MAFDEHLDDSRILAQVNVTPLVDVMLSMLVLFMVAVPLMQQGAELELPRETIAPIEGEGEQIVVSIDEAGVVYIGEGNIVEIPQLGERLTGILSGRQDKRVFVKADRRVDYGKVMAVMGSMRRAGVDKVGLITDPTPP